MIRWVSRAGNRRPAGLRGGAHFAPRRHAVPQGRELFPGQQPQRQGKHLGFLAGGVLAVKRGESLHGQGIKTRIRAPAEGDERRAQRPPGPVQFVVLGAQASHQRDHILRPLASRGLDDPGKRSRSSSSW